MNTAVATSITKQPYYPLRARTTPPTTLLLPRSRCLFDSSVTLKYQNYMILDVLDRVKSQRNVFQKQAKLNKITKSARSNQTTHNHETYQGCCT